MKRYIEGEDRTQATLPSERLDDYVDQDNPARVVGAFVERLDLRAMGFNDAQPAATGCPAYHPAVQLELDVYRYLDRVQSSRRLEREAKRNVELMWLTGRLMPDFATIANFRNDNGPAIRQVCRQFMVLCRSLNMFSDAIIAIDGGKFKAVNNRDRNFYRRLAGQRAIRRFTTIEHGMTLSKYWPSACPRCPLKARCTTSNDRRITRWEHEAVLDATQQRLDRKPELIRVRRQTVEHPFGTIKYWMGWTHFLMKTLPRVRTEMSLHVLAYNLKRVMRILGIGEMLAAIRA